MHKRLRSAAGYSLIEMMVVMGITSLVMAGVFSAMTQATRSYESAKLITGMNQDLRVAMDMMVRDLIQTGQGLPTGRQVGIPNGLGATPIRRPGPPANNTVVPNYPGVGNFPAGSTLLAVTVGPDLGPRVGGQMTDVITVIMVDGSFDQVPLRAVTATGSQATMTVALPAEDAAGKNISDAQIVDNIRVGELIMLRKGSTSTLLQATGVAGQVVTFANGNSANALNLNQFQVLDADEDTEEMGGTANQLVAMAPVDLAAPGNNPNGTPAITASTATRVRMTTYFIDPFTDPRSPRLMRVVDSRAPTTLAFASENLRFTYDIVDGINNPAMLRMVASETTPGAASPCESAADEVVTGCSPSQVRKINVVLAGRSRETATQTRTHYRNALFTQVSLRSLAFVDRYQ
jgi:prepilin-type N-terminal cleavage/methylation domain-containing protein